MILRYSDWVFLKGFKFELKHTIYILNQEILNILEVFAEIWKFVGNKTIFDIWYLNLKPS